MEQNDQNKIEIFKILYEHYKNDFTLYWTRSNFFLLTQIGLLGYFSSDYISANDGEIKYRLLITIIGFVLSLIWFLVVLSSTKWIKVWRNKVLEIDKGINPYLSFNKGEVSENTRKKPFCEKFRPEFLSNIMAIAFVVLWLTLFIILL